MKFGPLLLTVLVFGLSNAGTAQTVTLPVPQPLAVPDRVLLDEARRPVRLGRDLLGIGPVIVSFTYTGCQSVCPISDVVMNAVEDILVRRGDATIKLATLTIDPFNDTPEVLRARAAELGSGPRRRWLTGPPDDIFPVLDSLGVRFGRLEAHESFFLLVGGRGRRAIRVGIEQADAEALIRAVEGLR